MLTALFIAGFATVSAGEWAIVEGTSATTLVGVGADTDSNAVAGAASNGVGAFMQRFDGEAFNKEKMDGGMLLDAATEGSLTVATSMLPIFISTDSGKTYTPSETLGGISQSASIVDGVISLVGSFTAPVDKPPIVGTDGVARSSDAGKTWTVSPVPASYSRYGAFPSADTWYVSGGHWNYDEESLEGKSHRLSSRVHVSERGVSHRATHAPGRNATATSAEGETGYVATVSKTTDAGATWTTVFQSDLQNDYYYFNAIACSSEEHCVAVAEGDVDASGGNDARAYVTFDGGSSWENAIPRESWPEGVDVVSIMSAGWLSETEGFLGATAKNRGLLTGIFFHTTDGGKTYSEVQEVSDCFVLDMDFADTVGFCACSNSAGSASYVGMYA